MKLRRGKRPWSIWLFAALLLGPGLYQIAMGFQVALHDARFVQESFRIGTVARASTAVAIITIPVLAVVGYASRVAKWFVTIMSLASAALFASRLGGLAPALRLPAWVWFHVLLTHAPFLLLYLPSAREWFRSRKNDDAHVFD